MALPTGAYQGQDLINFNLGNKFLPRDYYSLNSYKAPLPTSETETVTQSFGIPYTNAFTGGGGGGGGGGSGAYTGREYNPESYITNRGYLSGDYIQGTEPEETYRDKIGGMIKSGIGMAIPGGNFLMNMAGKLDKFNTLSPVDQEFARQQMSFGEQSIHGGNLANQDRYGYNKRSLRGNYANVIAKRVAIAKKYQADNPDKKIRDIDQYYLDKEEEQNTLTNQMKFNDFIRQRHSADKIRAAQAKGIKTYPSGKDIHGPDTPDGSTAGTTYTGPKTYDFDEGAHRRSGGNRPDKPGGFTDPGKGSYGPHMAYGGRIGYRNGEFVDEDVNIQGPGFDVNENVEMAEMSPFELRIEELMDTGMSWQEAHQIASEEFGQVAQGEESFSQEGIASIV